MKTIILSKQRWWDLEKRLNVRISESEADDAFWNVVESNEEELKTILSTYGTPEDDWEVPWHRSRCRILYCYIYADHVYRPDLIAAIDRLLPRDGKQWYAQLECYTDSKLAPNGTRGGLGMLILHEGVAYLNDNDELAKRPELLGLKV